MQWSLRRRNRRKLLEAIVYIEFSKANQLIGFTLVAG